MMKKRIITAIASVFLLATLAVPASAQEASVNQQSSNNYQNNSVQANSTNNDNDMDWGWLGLLGLLGLAGMRKRVSDHSNRN
ncbi:WGxxGxxG family protein [Paenibacillus sp. W2I17]|uniref:WGxxGxxG family protein n=1 Tax=Paenibacillus sp. W2I17 TaxID=3042311 RepID=UPI00277FC66D|nr:WGxxGxxG family protein [Paenibacillus sp. W2I17]MDQ0658737.1 MYXO-CTERM domain-containing protein [Paenibacillus sp. W2I17]